ncbi:carbohydrate esterase family 4 protein [Mycena capillaripes]|nr:carbohydrate esterase family 4 protein [Mycena capillaripes]
MLASLIFAVLTAACASAHPMGPEIEARQGMATMYSSCKVKGDVALTFDDGPWIYLYDISKALVAAGAVGTFFFNGNNYACIYDTEEQKRVKYAYEHGHMIGSHTWAHKDLTKLTWDQIHDEMWRVEQALQRIIGVTPAFMRPPYGNYNDLVRQVAYVRNQSLAIWDFDSGDSTGSTVAQSKGRYDAVVPSHPNTLLALNHETYGTLPSPVFTFHQVLPQAISKLQGAGYKLVSLATCLGLQPYHSIGAPGTPDVRLCSFGAIISPHSFP